LVHELLKGYKDIILAPSLPEDPVQAQMVRGVADTAVNEIFDIIIGAYLWEKLREALPAKIFEDEEGMKTVQGLVFREMIKIPKRRFISLAQRINSGDQSAYSEMEEIADTVIDDLNKMDLEEILGSFDSYEDDDDEDMPTLPPSDDDDDDNIDLSFLDDFGIDKPKG
jgi:CBS domain containing-hemolysin-like protein